MKKKKKMLLAAVLAMTMILGACGGEASVVSAGNQGNSEAGTSASDSKQESKGGSEQSDGGNMVGKYNIFRFGEGQTAIDGDLLVASGMDKSYLELKADHTGVFVMNDAETQIEWNEDGDITTFGVKLYSFSLDGDVVKMDMMGTPITLVRDGAEAPAAVVESGGRPEEAAAEYISVISPKGFDMYYAYQVAIGDNTFYDCLQMGMTPENTKLQVNNEGSVYVTMGGYETKFTFVNGVVSTNGMDLYTYQVVSDEEIDLNMQGSIYRFIRENSELAKSVGLNENAVAGTGKIYIPNPGELEAEFEGGLLYYTDMKKFVEINYISTDQKDLYIPETIDGKYVRNVVRIEGTPENVYFPSCLVELSGGAEIALPSIKTITFGYGDSGELALDVVTSKAFDNLQNLESITYNGKLSEEFKYNYVNFTRCDKFQKIIGGSEVFWDNLKFCEYFTEKDPNTFIYDQPPVISDVAKEITKNATCDKEKVYEICKWVTYNIDYDPYPGEYTGYDGLGNPCVDVWLPIDVMDYRLTYCQGYANITAALCQAVGIPAVALAGKCENYGGNLGHQWTMVYIEGHWYGVDNTYEDEWVDEELVAKIKPREKISTTQNKRYEDRYPTYEDLPMMSVEGICQSVRFQPFVNRWGQTQEGFIFPDPTHDSKKIHYSD